ncbi:hypothetical protein SEA_ATUIN_291 [Arthrobacter phage Atuin]|nr:hypothetical protein SEA_ATUIN_90 [Arthrobacter phage Atuin]
MEQSKFVHAYLHHDYAGMVEGLRKEASAMVGKMDRWKKYHLAGDPMGMVKYYEEEFALVQKAVNYRKQIYKRQNKIADIIKDIEIARLKGDWEYDPTKQFDEWKELEAEIVGIAFKIIKVYFKLAPEVQDMGGNEEELENYEYKED